MMWLQLALGIMLMSFGADWVVGGVSILSRRLGMSTFIVSALVLGLGSNIPEIIVTLISAGTDLEGLILPNIITSNIFNILGIVGLCAVFSPIEIRTATKREINILLFASALLAVMLYDGKLDFAEGLGLFATSFYYINGTRQRASRYVVAKNKDTLKITMLLVGGIAFLYFGSEIFVAELYKMSTTFGLSGSTLGALVVAPGTSGPEIIVSILSIIRKKTPIMVGIMVGSCIAHLLWVAPIAGVLTEPETISMDYILMLLVTIVFAIDVGIRRRISRSSGFLYLGLLCLYFATVLV